MSNQKQKRHVTQNLNFRSNDIFNIQPVDPRVFQNLRQGKKKVINIKEGNFNGTSMVLDYTSINTPSNENDADLIKYRKFCEVKNRESKSNQLKEYNSHLTFVDFKKQMRELQTLEEQKDNMGTKEEEIEKEKSPSPYKSLEYNDNRSVVTENLGENKKLVDDYRDTIEKDKNELMHVTCNQGQSKNTPELQTKYSKLMLDHPTSFNIAKGETATRESEEELLPKHVRTRLKSSAFDLDKIKPKKENPLTNNLKRDYYIMSYSTYLKDEEHKNTPQQGNYDLQDTDGKLKLRSYSAHNNKKNNPITVS